VNLTLPYPPSANDYWHITRRGFVHVSPKARSYKARVGLAVRLAMQQRKQARVEGPVAVTVKVFRPRRVGDLDNTLKVLLDAMKGHAFEDDKQVVRILAERFDDANEPRVEVEVQPMETAE
jgi:crossover junction endodeoxyribonuclease RusA